MIKAINSIWKNVLFDFVVGLALVGLVSHNLFGLTNVDHSSFSLTDKLAMSAAGLLSIHLIFLAMLIVINFIQKTYIKTFIFLLTAAGVFALLQFAGPLLILSLFGSVPVH